MHNSCFATCFATNLPLFFLISFSSCGVLGSGNVPPKTAKAPSGSGLGIIVGSLPTLQSAGGGFGRPPGLVTTSRALFLAHLYGRLDNLHRKSAEDFVKSAAGWSAKEEEDRGDDVDSVGNIKDVEELHAAILCYQYLGLPLPKLRTVRKFLLKFWHEDAGLFAGQKGAAPHIRATAHAMAIAEQLGKVHKLHAQTSRIRQVLEQFITRPAAAAGNGTSQTNSTKKAPQTPQTRDLFLVPKNLSVGLSPVSANYFAVLVAGLTEFEGINASAMADHLTKLQEVTDKSLQTYGGVYGDSNRTALTLESTAHAVITLQALTMQWRSELSLALLLDEHALLAFLARAPSDLKSAYLAHYSLASTPLLTRYFRTSVAYHRVPSDPPHGGSTADPAGQHADNSTALSLAPATPDGAPHLGKTPQNQIVQGTLLHPSFSVTTFNGLPHAGLTARLRVCPARAACGEGGLGENVGGELVWSEERHGYTGKEAISTDGVLGELILEVTTRLLVPGLGEITFDVRDVINVGYGMKVSSVARLNDRSIPVGGQVSLGTVFSFQILLFTASQENIVSGDFVVKFHALDSSLLPVGSKELYGANSTDALAFGYQLPAEAVLPSGRMHFVFEVAASSHGTTHSHTTRWFDLPLQMAASNVTIDKPLASLGDTVIVSMTPGVVTNGTFRPYLQHLAHYRHFVMDLVSPTGVALASVSGRLAPPPLDNTVPDLEAPVQYLFERKVGYNLRSIGPNIVTFRFLPAPNAGAPVALANVGLPPSPPPSPRARSAGGQGGQGGAAGAGAEPCLVPSSFFTVAAQLRVQLGELPSPELAFGSNLTFSFTIRDEVTQTAVDITGEDDAKVYLEVLSPGAREVSVAWPMRSASGQVVGFEVHWHVHANAPTGALNLSLSMQDKQGMANNLLSSATGEEWQYTVRVSSLISGTVKSEHTLQEELEASGGGMGWWPGVALTVDGGGGEDGGKRKQEKEEGKGGADGDGEQAVMVSVTEEWESFNLERFLAAQEQLGLAVAEAAQQSVRVVEELSQVAWGPCGVALFVSVFELLSLHRPIISTLLTARVYFRPRPNPFVTFLSGFLFESYSPPPWQPIPDLQDLAVPWDSEGRYQVSWVLPLERALSGEYKAHLYRPVDVQTWTRQRELAQGRRKARAERAEKERQRKKLPLIHDEHWMRRREEAPLDTHPQPFFQIVIALHSNSMLRDCLGSLQRPFAWSSLFCMLLLLELGVYKVLTSDWRRRVASLWRWVKEAFQASMRGSAGAARGRHREQKRKKKKHKHRLTQDSRPRGPVLGEEEEEEEARSPQTASGAELSEVGMSGEEGGETEWDGDMMFWGDVWPWEEADEEEAEFGDAGRRGLQRIDSVEDEEEMMLEGGLASRRHSRQRTARYAADGEGIGTTGYDEGEESGTLERNIGSGTEEETEPEDGGKGKLTLEELGFGDDDGNEEGADQGCYYNGS